MFGCDRWRSGWQFDNVKTIDYPGLERRVQTPANQFGDGSADTNVPALSIGLHLRQEIIVE